MSKATLIRKGLRAAMRAARGHSRGMSAQDDVREGFITPGGKRLSTLLFGPATAIGGGKAGEAIDKARGGDGTKGAAIGAALGLGAPAAAHAAVRALRRGASYAKNAARNGVRDVERDNGIGARRKLRGGTATPSRSGDRDSAIPGERPYGRADSKAEAVARERRTGNAEPISAVKKKRRRRRDEAPAR